MKIEKAIEEDVKEKSSDKYFYAIAAVVVIGFGVFFLLGQLFGTPDIFTLDDLHNQNIEGDITGETGYLYNGFSFVFVDGLWYTRIQTGNKAYEIPLHFGPRDVENVEKIGTLHDSFNDGDEVYIVVDPLSENSDYTALAASELAQNMAIAVGRRPIGACDKNETSMCQSRDIVTCDTTDKPLVHLLQEPGPSVEYDGRCITLRGEGLDLTKAVDYLLLKWYQVIQ
jgi:hypothetical protein